MTLQPNQFYTMSVMKHPSGDRSYCHDLWEVIACNDTHAAIVKPNPGYSTFGADPVVVRIAEFDWTPAGDLAAAMADYGTEKVK
jgi:hypothetical protein